MARAGGPSQRAGRLAAARMLGTLWLLGALAGCGGVTAGDGGAPPDVAAGVQERPAAPASGAPVRTEAPTAGSPATPPPASSGWTRDAGGPLPFAVPGERGSRDGSPQYELRRSDPLSDPLRAHTQPRPDENVPPSLQRRQSRIDDHVNAAEDRARLEQWRRDQTDAARMDSRPEPAPDLNERRRYGTDMRADRY